jgi:hypothetical protein
MMFEESASEQPMSGAAVRRPASDERNGLSGRC